MRLLALPDDLSGKSVLDAGCNSGRLCFECKRRNAARVVGIDLDALRLEQARTLAEIMDLDVEFRETDLFEAPRLGRFDVVFCIAVLTEVTDIVRGFEVLKEVTGSTLYLELALRRPRRILGVDVGAVLERFGRRPSRKPHRIRPAGTAGLRKIHSGKMTGWSLVPDRQFIESIMGDEFHVEYLGPSTRYDLLKLTRR